MAITKVINDAVDLNQTSDYSGLRLPVGTTSDVVETFTTDYLVVGGGGSGGKQIAAGGGAGGLRTSYNNSTTTTNSLSFPSGKTAIATYMLNGDATDVSTNYNGAESSITYVAGEYGGAASFNGSSSYIQTTLTKPAGTAFSFSCWINTPGGVAQHIVGDYNSSIANPTFRIQIPANNTLSVGVGTGTGAVSYVSFPTISGLANTWKNLIITVDGTSVNAYINGVALGTTQTSAQTLGAGAQPYTLGAYRPAAGYQNFSGSIDQVRIYDSALSGTDASNIYSNEVQANSGGGSAAESSLTLTEGTAYDVTVGAGGASVTAAQNARGNNGQSSIFSTITSLGGGGGGTSANGIEAGLSGGSGGGSARSGGSGGNGTTDQGYAGGAAAGTSAGTQGGGGGSSSLGVNGSTTSPGTTQGNGGTGLEVNIIGGTNNYYASGGGAGSRSDGSYNFRAGTASAGGGTDGTTGNTSSESGVFNTGGGSGGTGYNGVSSDPGNGGSGVVILRYPTASVSSFTTTGTLNIPSTTDTLANTAYPVTNAVYYKLDGNATDSSGNGNNGTDSNVTWANGRFSQAAVFNGSNSFIDTNYTLPADSTMSFSFWINVASLPSDDRYILSDLSSSGTDRRLDIRLKGSDGAKLYIDIGNGTSNTTSNNTGFIPTVNTWYNIVVTLNGTSINVYINNGTAISMTSSVSFGTAGARSLSLGRAGDYNGAYYNGSIDQVRIFGSALSASNVTDLYNEHYQTKFTDGSDTAIVFTEGTGTVTFSGVLSPPQGALRTNTSYSEDGSASVIEHYNGTDWKYFDAIKYCTTNTLNFPSGAGCVASYNLNNNVNDIGNTYNGTNSNVTFIASGKFGAAAVFNGSSSKIDLGNNTSNNTPTISVSLWFKTSGSSAATLINNGGANGGETGYFLGLNSNGTIKFDAGSGIANGSVNYADNNWHNIVLTLNSGAYNIYVNGNTTPVLTGSGAFTSTATRPTWIGQFSYTPAALEFFNGSIDQVRIFNDSLTSTEVLELYNNEIACS